MHESIHESDLPDEIDRAIVAILQQQKSGYPASKLLASLAKQGHSISQPTLSRRLRRLQARRHVIAHKAGRSTIYERDPFHDWFSLPPTRRPKVSYNIGLLERYTPNETRWFSQEDIERLHEAGGDKKLDASTYSRAIAQKLLVDLSFASSALEGNTYSYLDTQVLVEFGQAAEGKAAEETQMILNHKEAIQYLVDNISEIEISPRELRTLHALLSRGLIEPAAVGDVRKRPVDIGGSAYVPLSIPQKLTEELASVAAKAAAIQEPFEQSLFLMAFISYLQPFLDVNKRTGRLACNIPLLKNGLAPLSFLEMDKEKYVEGLLVFYELNRVDLLKSAYIQGYVDSASRYDAYVGRDRSAVELEVQRRADIHAFVKSYIEKSVRQGRRVDTDVHAHEYFHAEPKDLQSKLIERVGKIIAALNDANHIAYGIPKKMFGDYQRLPVRGKIRKPRPAK
jgi:hypothetical protein